MDFGTASQTQEDTTETNGRQLLQDLCDNGFDGSISACALALGREHV